jgi:hypothetical protein
MCNVDINLLLESRLRPRGESRQRTYFLRIGQYNDQGETFTASGQLKAGIRPPRHARAIKSAQRKLAADLAPVLVKYRNSQSVSSATNWVKWAAIDEYSLFLAEERDGESDLAGADSESDAESDKIGESNNNALVSTNSTINDTVTVEQPPAAALACFSVASQPYSQAKNELYPPDHPNAKYPLLNSLNRDLMDRSSGSQGIQSRALMDSLLREIAEFKESIGEPMGFESINSKKTVNLVPYQLQVRIHFMTRQKVGLMSS